MRQPQRAWKHAKRACNGAVPSGCNPLPRARRAARTPPVQVTKPFLCEIDDYVWIFQPDRETGTAQMHKVQIATGLLLIKLHTDAVQSGHSDKKSIPNRQSRTEIRLRLARRARLAPRKAAPGTQRGPRWAIRCRKAATHGGRFRWRGPAPIANPALSPLRLTTTRTCHRKAPAQLPGYPIRIGSRQPVTAPSQTAWREGRERGPAGLFAVRGSLVLPQWTACAMPRKGPSWASSSS